MKYIFIPTNLNFGSNFCSSDTSLIYVYIQVQPGSQKEVPAPGQTRGRRSYEAEEEDHFHHPRDLH